MIGQDTAVLFTSPTPLRTNTSNPSPTMRRKNVRLDSLHSNREVSSKGKTPIPPPPGTKKRYLTAQTAAYAPNAASEVTAPCRKCTSRKLSCPGFDPVPLRWDQGVASRGKLSGRVIPVLPPKDPAGPRSESGVEEVDSSAERREYDVRAVAPDFSTHRLARFLSSEAGPFRHPVAECCHWTGFITSHLIITPMTHMKLKLPMA